MNDGSSNDDALREDQAKRSVSSVLNRRVQPRQARLAAMGTLGVLVVICLIMEMAARLFGAPNPTANGWVSHPIEGGYDVARPAQGFRVMVLGDELAGGAFRSLESRYQARWKVPYQIIELDPSADSPAEIFDAYFDTARESRPQVLILTVSPSDLAALDPELSQGWEASYYKLNPDGSMGKQDVQAKAQSGLSGVSALARSLSLVAAREGIPAGAHLPAGERVEANFSDPRFAASLDVFVAIVSAINTQAQAEGAHFGVIVVPDVYSVYPNWYFADYPQVAGTTDLFDPGKIEREMIGVLDAYGIAHVELAPYMQADTGGESLFRRHENRLTHAGHDLVTEALDNWFSHNGWAAASGQ